MNITVEGTLAKFKLYSGEPLDGQEPGRDALCRELCGECARWVQDRLLPDAPQEGLGTAEGMAAAEAFYQLALLDQSGAPETVSTPELKLELRGRAEYARRLREEKHRAGAGLMQEEGFYFAQA